MEDREEETDLQGSPLHPPSSPSPQLLFIHFRGRGYTPRPLGRPADPFVRKGVRVAMIYDGLILLILVLATWRGASRGLAWQVAWIGAIVLCFLFATPLSLYVTPHIKLDPPLNRWVAMLAIYMGFSFVSFAIARMLRGWLEETKFQEFDSHLGAIFGLAKGVLISLVLTFFLVGLSTSARDYILKTNSGYAAETIFRKLHPIMPREIEHVLEKYDHFGIPVSHDAARDGGSSSDRLSDSTGDSTSGGSTGL